MSSDRITPAELRQLADIIEGEELEIPEIHLAINGATGKTDAKLLTVKHEDQLVFDSTTIDLG